ncbi:MAG: efflux transporter periplasmic adaptor subunit [Sphingomonas bacterium]|jgi:HlyD family secretion protein|nr:efflux RND transporter periplasmic adaptor subunit [Sphingomonas bacterium]MDB5689204.1 efflux transporter periplasmic adaptor subunit [Sphingomonas bacterium]
MNVEHGFTRHGVAPDQIAADSGRAPARRRLLWIGGIVLLALLVAGIVLWRRSGPAPVADAPELPRVTVIVPGRQVIASVISTTGSLAARREMPVGIAGEGGMVSRVLVEAGQWVSAGQTLATIERSVQVQESAALNASIAVARADAELAQAELDRARQLVGRGFISKADVDRRTATRDAANARVRVAQAQFGQARARIGRLDIRAPAAGLILTRSLEPGQIVGPSTASLFRIARGGEMEMLARVSEQDLARLRVGVPATVTPTGTTSRFNGRIWQLSPVIDPASRQGTARIALAYDPALRPGGFANADIMSGTADAPLLPESAVQSDAKGNFVYTVDAGGRVVRRDVRIGEVSDRGIAIASGLNGSEQIVLSAGAFLNPGDKVVAQRQAAPR